MYTRRAALATLSSLRTKVRKARTSDFPYFVKSSFGFVRYLSTATERSDFYNNFDGNVSENQSDYRIFSQNCSFYGENLSGAQIAQNPGGVYGPSPQNQLNAKGTEFSNGSDFNGAANQPRYSQSNHLSGSYGMNSDECRENKNPSDFDGQYGNYVPGHRSVDQETADVKGYGGSGNIVGFPQQNYGGAWQYSSRDHFSGNREMLETKFNYNYAERRENTWQNVHNAGFYQQNSGGISYPHDGGRYEQNKGELRTDGVVHSQVQYDFNSNMDTVDSKVGSQPRSRLEDLDELTKEGKIKEAVELLELLKLEGLQVDLPRYMALMKVCSEKEALEEAKSIHKLLTSQIPHPEVRVYNKILEMYSRCGSMDDTFAVFDSMPKRNLTSWDIMISWLAKNGHGESSIELFEEFKRSGLRPDAQLFLGVFSACAVLCDIVEGMLHFESMTKDYGIFPSMKHYVGIVGMLGSAGCLEEALEFIENMPMEPTIDIWETLMRFSRIHGNVELGDRCAEIIELLDPSRLNEQSKSGLIPINAADLAREKEKKKLSGQSLLDVRGRVHEYRAGDRSHPDADKLYTLLRGLKQQMKEVGYIPETKFVLHDTDQESKEEALMAHSERLAAAQGFLTSAARSPLRIIKNLRVCGDCHNAFKIISKIVGRQIIARDTKRFHHFENGSCSCNDYW